MNECLIDCFNATAAAASIEATDRQTGATKRARSSSPQVASQTAQGRVAILLGGGLGWAAQADLDLRTILALTRTSSSCSAARPDFGTTHQRNGTRTRQTWTARQPPRISRSLGRLIRPDKADRARAHITALFSLTDMAHLQKQLKGDVWPLLHATPAKRGRPPHQQPFRAAQLKSHRAWRQERASSSLLPPPPWPLSTQSSAREAQRLSAHY